jgi:predicted enzyme related to lactoylglutathione lyase
MGPGARRIEVAPPGAATAPVPYTPPGLESRIGTFSGLVFDCDDIKATDEEPRGRGVPFTQEPAPQPWGMLMALFKDADGNGFVLVQSKG